MDVVWALGAISGPRANKALLSIEQLKGMPKRLHGMRAMALGMQGRAAGTKILVQLHGQQSSTIRMTILWSLGLIGDNTAVDFLIKQLAMESTDTQRMIVWALGASGSKKAIGPLLGLVVSDHPRIAQAAWRSIAWILAPSPQHTQKLREKYLALHDFHRGRLLLTPSSAMNPLMNWPETNTTHAPLLMQAHSGTILKTLLNHIRSADAATRRRTILALIPRAHEPNSLVLTGIEGTPIPPSWTESLHVALLERLEKEPNTGVRAAAALALGYIASDRSIRALGLAILDAPVAVQRASVVALTGIPKRLATTTLIDASKAVLAGQDWPTKTRFAHALGTALSLHPDRANEIVPTLHTLVIDVAIEVRIAALESLLLASSRHRPAIDVLRRRIQEQDPVVAKTTIRLLERWALPESESLINEASHHAHPAIRTAAKAAIQRIQKRKPH
jgi:HEAT repeat protein